METWTKVAHVSQIPIDGGGCVKVGEEQIAIFHYDNGEWYALQNRCPHQNQEVLSKGLLGDTQGEPKVACPMHKHTFSLKTGKHLGGNPCMHLKTYPLKIEEGVIWIDLSHNQALAA